MDTRDENEPPDASRDEPSLARPFYTRPRFLLLVWAFVLFWLVVAAVNAYLAGLIKINWKDAANPFLWLAYVGGGALAGVLGWLCHTYYLYRRGRRPGRARGGASR